MSYRRVLVLAGLAATMLAAPAPTQEEPAAAAAAPVPAAAPAAMAEIDRGDLQRHASYLAADELGGRYTGSEGQRMAARYIADHFEKLGLQPRGERVSKGWSFFQRYPLVRTEIDLDKSRLTIGNEQILGGFAVIPGKKLGAVDVRGVFAYCGRGEAKDLPKGGLRSALPVVVLAAEQGGAGRALRAGFRLDGISRALANKGAKAVIFCLLDDQGTLAEAMNYRALLPDKPLLEFGNQGSRAFPPHSVPAVFVNKLIGTKLLAAMGVDVDGGQVRVKKLQRVTGRLQLLVTEDKKGFATNVCAWLEGASPSLRDEAVVFSAHMDHMGTRVDGDPFNGADDNASGTAALLEVAEAMCRGEPPQRSILFLSVSGEEEGLWGSEWYAENPTWPLAKLIADVNIDMIGRATDLSGPREIAATPSYRHAKFNTLVRDAARLARALGMEGLTDGDRYYERSDHYNFASRGVPVVFFSDGEHEDYHKVTDHADKLDYAKMELVARLAYWVGLEAANAPARPRELGSQSSWDGGGR